ncbi:MAG: 3-oxoacyl-ACP synthase [Gammaproteobacteria bacterium RIFCSPHIGHO2_12_FULL_41_15]|nr:MAG: 3-oxoacyl-ACP synthase [Gammaproteobacteria bacterium RIFCSPHIGHO2_12_FULL_41_15]
MTSQGRRVAVTGIGIVSPLGLTKKTSWDNLIQGKSGIAPIQQFDASGFPTQIAAEVKNFTVPKPLLKSDRYRTRFTHFALMAAKEALQDANCMPTPQTAKRWGVVVGSGMMTAEFEYLQRFQQAAAKDGSPNWQDLAKANFCDIKDFGKTTSNAGLSLLIQSFGIKGYATSVHTACASSGQALGLALNVIRRNEADCILAGGFDSMINPLGLSSFCLLGALSTANETPSAASRPFDAKRNGFVLGEGAAFLILESFEHANKRGAKIYAEFAGEGNSLSAYRITDSHPDGFGAIEAIENALRDANLSPNDVDYINAHGTSTLMNDLSETNAIKAVFGREAYNIPTSSTKSQTGHLIAAAGALEAAFSVLSLQNAILPPTANLTNKDPACDLDFIVEGPRAKAIKVALSNSFGFGGSNSCLAFIHKDLRGSDA